MTDHISQADPQLVDAVRQLLTTSPQSQQETTQRAVIPDEVRSAPEASRGLEHPQGIAGWLWDQFANVAKAVICGPEIYEQLIVLSQDDIKMKVDDILIELIGQMTEKLPGWLKPLIPIIRPLAARAIAFEIHVAINDGLSSYCAMP